MSSILAEERPDYAVLRINRPQQRNAMNRATRQALTSAYADLAGRFSVVVLTGTEQSFCSGVDLKEELADRQAGNDVARQEWVATLLSLRAQPAILIAAVNGFALGGGLSLINVSDLAIAAKDPTASFAMLTPAYQRASGGLGVYRRFWGSVTGIHGLSAITPTLDPLAATYTYSYTLRGDGTRTDQVHLKLVFDNGSYLIDGGSSKSVQRGHGNKR